MRLLIIGHTSHYLRDGQLVGWGATIKEINWLAPAFDEVVHLACFHPGPAPDSALPYTAENVRVVTVPPGGGLSLSEKLRTVWLGPLYLWRISQLLPQADVVHVRVPGSLGMYGMMAASLIRKPKWVKYAGNWVAPRQQMAPSHFFQRWWLHKGLINGAVTVNGRWPDQPSHVYTFLNPSVSLDEARQASKRARAKKMDFPARILFVGHASAAKGLDTALTVVRQLFQKYGDKIKFDIVGGGPEQARFEQWAAKAGLGEVVAFHGWLPHYRVAELMMPAHFLFLPSKSEGWPKVLSEAMTFGAVPIASDVAAVPQILADTKAGIALPGHDVPGFVQAMAQLIDEPERWLAMSQAGLAAAPLFAYERYLMAVNDLFATAYGHSPLNTEYVTAARQKFDAAVHNLPRQFWLEGA